METIFSQVLQSNHIFLVTLQSPSSVFFWRSDNQLFFPHTQAASELHRHHTPYSVESNHVHWRTQNHCYHILVHARHWTTCFVLVGRGFTAKKLQTKIPALLRVSHTKIYSVREQQEWGCSIKRDKPGLKGGQSPGHAFMIWCSPMSLNSVSRAGASNRVLWQCQWRWGDELSPGPIQGAQGEAEGAKF